MLDYIHVWSYIYGKPEFRFGRHAHIHSISSSYIYFESSDVVVPYGL